MRDTLPLFRSASLLNSLYVREYDENIKYIRTAITAAVESSDLKQNDFDLHFMGEFKTIQECVNHVLATLNRGMSACLVTGSLNYIPPSQWRTSADIDVCMFVNEDGENRYSSYLYEHDMVDLVITRVSGGNEERIIRKRILPIYYVARLFYNVRYQDKITNAIVKLKHLCDTLELKSKIVPAFKSFVIAIVSIKGSQNIDDDLTTLCNLKSIDFISESINSEEFEVKVYLHETNIDLSVMEQHIVNTRVGDVISTRRMGSVALRRGMTYLLRRLGSKPDTANTLLTPPEIWLDDTFNLPEGSASLRMKSVIMYLDTEHKDHIAFIKKDPVENKLKVFTMKDRLLPDTPFVIPTVNTPVECTVCFWEFSEPSGTAGIEIEEHPELVSHGTLRTPLVTMDGKAASDEGELFLFSMLQRRKDNRPLISRHVDDATAWLNTEGLCHCHSNVRLPTEFVYEHPEDGRIHLTQNNDVAYTTHMKEWFDSELGKESGFKRFTDLIKYLDTQQRGDNRMGEVKLVQYTPDTSMLIFSNSVSRDLVKALGPRIDPVGEKWSVKEFRAAWANLRRRMGEVMSVVSDAVLVTSPRPRATPSLTPNAPAKTTSVTRFPKL